MAMRIFETDPDAKPRARQFDQDFVGRFRSGRMVGKRPEALNHWRVTTGDPVVAARVEQLLGGTAEEWDTDNEDNLEVLTESAAVRIIVASSDALTSDMRLYGNQGMIHHCDGVEFLSPDEDKGKPCGCPRLLQDRKELAKSGRGPKPSINLVFKLEAAPELGFFRFNSGSWELAKVLHEGVAALDGVEGPAMVTLTIENVSYTTKAGRDVSYNKPVIKVIGAASAEAAEDLPLAA